MGPAPGPGHFELTPVEPVCRSVPPLLTTFHRDRADRLVGPITGCAQARLDFIPAPAAPTTGYRVRGPAVSGCRLGRSPSGHPTPLAWSAGCEADLTRRGRPIDRTQQGGGGTERAFGPPPLVLAAHQRLLPSFPPTNAYRPPAAPAGRPVLTWLWQRREPGGGDFGPRQALLLRIYNVMEEPEQRRFRRMTGGATWRQAA